QSTTKSHENIERRLRASVCCRPRDAMSSVHEGVFWAGNPPVFEGNTLQSADRAEGDHGDRSAWRRLLVMAVWRRCTRRELEQSVAFGTDHFLGEERSPEATA